MTNSNFFLVNRGLLSSDRWLSEPFTRGQAWIDMFGLAQHSDGFFRVRGIKISVQRGQLAYSQVTLSERWKWSRGKVKRYLDELEKDGDIVQQNNEVTTLITIVKYDFWQKRDKGIEQQTVQQTDSKRASNGTHTKNDNNENNVNNDNKPDSEATIVARAPKDEAKEFFEKIEIQESVVSMLTGRGVGEDVAREEVMKFVSYWTEPNRLGTKQRWQMEKTFEIRRRLVTWFGRVKTQGKGFNQTKTFVI